MEDVNFSIICVYNNKKQLESQLLKSLKINNVECELILIDNCNGRFKSAASALNYGGKKATGDVLFFVHQDIYIKFSGEIEKMAVTVLNSNIGDIFGAAGARNKVNICSLTDTYGGDNLFDRRMDYLCEQTQVQTIDECLIAVRKETFNKYLFNEDLCDGWHLYAVELCLRVQKCEGKVFVFPIECHHFSSGSVDINYMKCFVKLSSIYRKDYNYISTTVKKQSTNYLAIRIYYLLWILKRILCKEVKKLKF